MDANSIQQHQKELCQKLWAMANALRGNMEAYEFKNYILGMIFYYYLSKREEEYMVNLLKDDGITFKEAWEDEEYKEAVIKEALRVLKTYGLRGFNESWSDGMDVFPINSLLVLLGADVNYNEKTWDCNSNIFTELDILKDALSKHS